VGEIGVGFVLLVAISRADKEVDAGTLASKIVGLRVFSDDDDKMNLSLADVGGSVLLISQFTLYGDTRKGRRPSFVDSASAEIAAPLIGRLETVLSEAGVRVQTGVFGAAMRVELVNDGPVTLILETKNGKIL
jgi:D-tyrosyl-tRNA(Tyr) deacylase